MTPPHQAPDDPPNEPAAPAGGATPHPGPGSPAHAGPTHRQPGGPAGDDLPYHRLDGSVRGTPLILGPSLGTSLAVWEPQLDELARHHRVLRFDLPGHGRSPAVGPVTVARLAELVLALADRQGWDRFHYAGISLGGAIGAHLAVHRPERVSSLAVVCSSARFGDPAAWRQRAARVRAEGTGPLVAASASRWFADPERSTGTLAGKALLADLAAADPEGYAACCEALAAYDLRAELRGITAPTLVVAGRADLATPPAHARELADGIPGAGLTEIAGAAHLAGVDRPEAVTAALLGHLGTASPRTTGERVRRAVLGDAHVDRATARGTPFTAPFQDLITRYAWGEIWTRPGLDRRTRSCVTLTALVAHGHHDELALHVRAALTNGLTPDEIGEVLLQTAVYCGVPAANSAFATARRVLDDVLPEE
ncbi:3-oxoadipate enol-lactonase [Streptomyces venezuelae]|uniref:bifunctional 3-oxoadipate enol-lactonase/4-carboxymuconolactone decarboxylase PcaDC n=1 Tax=Streptomyces venezuelae TaxID=54571 RepID=UPI00123A4726|nr:3-oxoadipate enol-lactonase [Streptomyces venezuelae]QES10134.1 3-oxoadipate enol-lactonase [Streptomyces venezuelae]